jgi:molybdenum cofactor biosynthesis enzyme MoaA
MFSLDYIKKQIDFEYEYGIRDFEITGGEPSEYNKLREVCQYIKSKNKDSKIAVITNGGLWKCDVWDLIDEVLVSYHISKNDHNINKDFFPLGHTYDKVKKTIDLAR